MVPLSPLRESIHKQTAKELIRDKLVSLIASGILQMDDEIPSERELPSLLDELNSPQIGYWHDFGHLQIKENLGFVNHEEWLRLMGSRTIGCHVQDCIWPAQDHQPPFAGTIDLAKLVPLLSPNCLLVWEISPRKTSEEIRKSLALWKERFGE